MSSEDDDARFDDVAAWDPARPSRRAHLHATLAAAGKCTHCPPHGGNDNSPRRPRHGAKKKKSRRPKPK